MRSETRPVVRRRLPKSSVDGKEAGGPISCPVSTICLRTPFPMTVANEWCAKERIDLNLAWQEMRNHNMQVQGTKISNVGQTPRGRRLEDVDLYDGDGVSL